MATDSPGIHLLGDETGASRVAYLITGDLYRVGIIIYSGITTDWAQEGPGKGDPRQRQKILALEIDS